MTHKNKNKDIHLFKMLLNIEFQITQVITIIAAITTVSFQEFCFLFPVHYEI